MELDAGRLLEILLVAILGGLTSGGALIGLFYRAIKDRLYEDFRKEFPHKSELIPIKDKQEAYNNLWSGLDNRVGANERILYGMEKETTYRINPILDRIEDIAEKQNSCGEKIERGLIRLEKFEGRLEDMERKLERKIDGN